MRKIKVGLLLVAYSITAFTFAVFGSNIQAPRFWGPKTRKIFAAHFWVSEKLLALGYTKHFDQKRKAGA